MDTKIRAVKNLIVLTGGLLLASFLFLPAPRVSAYNGAIVHPDLTRETVAFYELSTGRKLTDEQKQWIGQGSIDEDKAPRWINHFYDPAFERGLSTTALGFGYAGYPAKNWAQFSSYQTLNPANIANLWTGNGPVFSGSWWGDFSYEAAIKNYSQSKEKEAYMALGNVLHVIGDMTVPEHVRNEAHPGGSFYEAWTMNNSSGLTQDLGKRLFNQGWKPVVYSGLGTYFNELANYTSTHFFGPETINSELYQKPKIVFDDGTFAYGYDENYQLFDLATVTIDKSLKKSYSIKDNNHQILQEYWLRLSRQAVINGAGIISLFVDQAEAAKKVELAKQKVDAGLPAQAGSTGSPQNSFIGFLTGLISSSPGEKSPEPAMTLIAGEPKITAPKINPIAPKTTPVVQTPAASPPVPAAPKTALTPAPSPAPAPKIATSTPITMTPAPITQPYSSSGGSSVDATEQTTAQTFAAGVLVINEIMYNPEGADTTDGKSHEWIEIYNNSASSVDLTGWKINDGDGDTNHGLNPPPENGGQGSMTIPAAGYSIITAHAETFLADHAGFTGAFIDTANGVTLKNSTSTIKIVSPDGAVIDEVTYYNSWGGNGDGKTLEKVTAGGASGAASNWGASSATGGTPGAANNPIAAGEGGPIINVITGTGTDIPATTTISQNTTWTLANSPYRLFFDGQRRPTVAAGAILTIEPGVKIIPQASGATAMEIKGTLQAVATSGAPIIFTSKNDADGDSATIPQKGDWLNIVFSGASGAAQSNLDYVEFRYGGQGNVRPLKEMVKIIGATVNIKNSKFENAQSTALRLVDSDSVVENSVFSDNDCAISIDILKGDGNTDGGCSDGTQSNFSTAIITTPRIKNNQFIRNRVIAIEIRNGATPFIDNNVFTDNGYPVRIDGAYPAITNSQITNSTTSPNIINGIAISNYTHFSKNYTLKKDLPYILEGNASGVAPYIDAGATLTIEPGTILKTDNIGSVLFVNGGLIASTTPASQIIFTSSKDVPQAGDWGNIRFNAGSTGNFANTIFSYAGAGFVPHNLPAVNTLAKNFPAISVSGTSMGMSGSEWTAGNSNNFNKIIIHNFSFANPQKFNLLAGIKNANDNQFIASVELENLQNISGIELTASIQGQYSAGTRYYAVIQVNQPNGTSAGVADSFTVGQNAAGTLAMAFYELVPGGPANPALSIDAAAIVVVE